MSELDDIRDKVQGEILGLKGKITALEEKISNKQDFLATMDEYASRPSSLKRPWPALKGTFVPSPGAAQGTLRYAFEMILGLTGTQDVSTDNIVRQVSAHGYTHRSKASLLGYCRSELARLADIVKTCPIDRGDLTDTWRLVK